MSEASGTPLQFQLRRLGHVVLNVTDLEAAVRFYTDVLGLQVSDRYPDSMVPGGMVFLRCNTDHHGIALVGGHARTEATSLNHFAFEVGTLDEVFRPAPGSSSTARRSSSRGGGAPAARSRWSSRTPTATTSRSTGTWTRSAPPAACVPRKNGAPPAPWKTPSPIPSQGSGLTLRHRCKVTVSERGHLEQHAVFALASEHGTAASP